MNRETHDPPASGTASEAAFTPAGFEPFDCIAIVGVGLMGGSMGLALREKKLTRRVIGIDLLAESVKKAVEVGAIDDGTNDLMEIAEADCVVFAAPVGILPTLMERAAPFIRSDALITDLGSVKGSIVEAGERWFGPRFVGGHPMSGSEASGIEAARSDLFEGAAWAIARSRDFNLAEDTWAARLAALVAVLGARPLTMTAGHHDHLVALVSHLPHLLSFAFARTVEGDTFAEQARQMAGGSYRDLIRVSGSSPELWRDIFLHNREALQAALIAYEYHLMALKDAIENKDVAAVLQCLQSIE